MRLFTTVRRRPDRVPSIGELDLVALADGKSLVAEARADRFAHAWSAALGRAWGVPFRVARANPSRPGPGACAFRLRLGGLPIVGSLDRDARGALLARAVGAPAPLAVGLVPSILERSVWSRLLLEPAVAAWLRALELPIAPIEATVLPPGEADPPSDRACLPFELSDADGRPLGRVRFHLPQAWWQAATPEGGERLGRSRLGGAGVELVASLSGSDRPIGLRALATARPGDLLLTDLRIGAEPPGAIPVRLDPAGASRLTSDAVRPLLEGLLGAGRSGGSLAVRPLGPSGSHAPVR